VAKRDDLDLLTRGGEDGGMGGEVLERIDEVLVGMNYGKPKPDHTGENLPVTDQGGNKKRVMRNKKNVPTPEQSRAALVMRGGGGNKKDSSL